VLCILTDVLINEYRIVHLLSVSLITTSSAAVFTPYFSKHCSLPLLKLFDKDSTHHSRVDVILSRDLNVRVPVWKRRQLITRVSAPGLGRREVFRASRVQVNSVEVKSVYR